MFCANSSSGSMIVPTTYPALHDPVAYPEPESFDPERWISGDAEKHPKNWLVFGTGPHYCLGQTYATLNLMAMVGKACVEMDWKHEVTPLSEEIKIFATIFPQVSFSCRCLYLMSTNDYSRMTVFLLLRRGIRGSCMQLQPHQKEFLITVIFPIDLFYFNVLSPKKFLISCLPCEPLIHVGPFESCDIYREIKAHGVYGPRFAETNASSAMQ